MNVKKIGIYNASTPISKFFPNKTERSKKFLENKNLEVIYGNLTFLSKNNYVSGTPQERADEIKDLIIKHNVDILMPSIGGSNTSSILQYLDFDLIKKSNVKIIGHSDTTCLSLAVYAKTKKITYISSSLVVGFDNEDYINDFHYKTLIDNCINDKLDKIEFPKRYTDSFLSWDDKNRTGKKEFKNNKFVKVKEGKIKGKLIGGNLNTLIPMLNTEFFPKVNKNTILFFEETCAMNELNLALVEKNISSLINSGILNKIGGLIIGKCEGFDRISDGIKYIDFILELLPKLNIPILAEVDFAHTLPITTIAIGSTIILDVYNKEITRIK